MKRSEATWNVGLQVVDNQAAVAAIVHIWVRTSAILNFSIVLIVISFLPLMMNSSQRKLLAALQFKLWSIIKVPL